MSPSTFTPMPWASQGACKPHPTAWWYSDLPDEQRRALIICSNCPVRDDCKAHAITHREEGIWGGVLFTGRARDTGRESIRYLECPQCHNSFTALRLGNGRPRIYCSEHCACEASRARRRERDRRDATARMFDRLKAELGASA